MAEQKFKSGNVVRLKSGGPKMTVQNYTSFGMGVVTKDVYCKWFEGNKPMTGEFHEDGLELVDE